MLHEPASQSGPDPASGYKQKLGVIMFTIYALVYCGFTVVSVTNVELMEKIVFKGMNLAIVYGFGLIIFALVLAVIYNHKCTAKEKEMFGQEETE